MVSRVYLEPLVVGVTGMVLIIVGWVFSSSNPPPLRLSLPYLSGSLLLAVYAFLIGDPIFTILNSLASVVALNNIRIAILKKS